MDIEIANKEKESGKIAVATKGCILCNIVGYNPRSIDFGMKYGLYILIEWVISNISRGCIWSGCVCWEGASTGNKTRLYRGGSLVEMWFDWEMELPELFYT